MDLGCGTGLFGLEINQFCVHLEGRFIGKMLESKGKMFTN